MGAIMYWNTCCNYFPVYMNPALPRSCIESTAVNWLGCSNLSFFEVEEATARNGLKNGTDYTTSYRPDPSPCAFNFCPVGNLG